MKLLSAPLAICLLFSAASAQRTRQKPPVKRPPSAQPTPTPTPAVQTPVRTVEPPQTPLNPISIASVNGRTITTAEFEPGMRQELESVNSQISSGKKNLLDLQINTLLLQAEARKRGMTTERLYALEVSSKLAEPTPAEIKKFAEQNSAQLAGMDASTAASQIATYLMAQREEKLSDEFVQRLKKQYPVLPGADINAPDLKDDAIVATVAGQPVKAGVINERMKPIKFRLQITAYETAKKRADEMIDDLLLLAEANKRQIGPEQIVRTEITDKIRQPTDAEVTKFYQENKSRINADFERVRFQISAYLQEQDKERLEKELSARLRKGADIKWFISEPAQPVQAISTDDDPSRGDVNAPVTIVEFTDFQCPSCAAMHPILDEVLKSYGNRVRLVVRDYPLSQHENALKAAEAANAANEQGKFFEYIALLYKRQSELDTPSLKKYATELGLNRQKFDAALASGTYAAEIKHDIADAEIYGVGSTPTLFINGVMLRNLSEEGLRQAIDRAAAARRSGTPPQ
jgi:protein-disulfide isomerase